MFFCCFLLFHNIVVLIFKSWTYYAKELFDYLISLVYVSIYFYRHNTNAMVHIGLSLLTVALESGAPHLGHFSSLMALIKDDLCRNIFSVRIF